MTLGQLRAFLAVVETGSIRGAAERLVVTQPAVSTSLSALQRSLGVALTIRDGRGLRLTAAGETFADYARRVVALLDEGIEAAAGRAAPERGRLRLAAVTTAAENVVPAFLATFRSRYPGARIGLEVGNRAKVWDLLEHHEVDLVVAGRPPASAPFVVGAVRDNALALIAPSNLDPANRRTLGQCTWLMREPGSGTRGAVEDIFDQLGIDPPRLTLGSNGAIRESVQAGLGISVLSRDAVAGQLERGHIAEWRIPPFPIHRPWHVVTRGDRPLPPTAALFLEHLLAPNRDDGFRPAAQPFGSLGRPRSRVATIVR
jgi:DNA-binding transcriptional LysR family regulator